MAMVAQISVKLRKIMSAIPLFRKSPSARFNASMAVKNAQPLMTVVCAHLLYICTNSQQQMMNNKAQPKIFA